MNIIIGLGKTGLSCVAYFRKRNQPVMIFDTRDHPPNADLLASCYPEVTLIAGALPLDVLCNADELIVSPGISLKTPAIAEAMSRGVRCIGDVELFVREAKAPIIAITGSNGKTTVTTLIGQLLKDANYRVEVCGNIGTPVLETLDREVPDFYVVELSSFQLETTYSLKAAVALVLNVSSDHMDRYVTIEDYAMAKRRIYQQCDVAVLNADEPVCWEGVHFPVKRESIFFSCIDDKGQQQKNNTSSLIAGKDPSRIDFYLNDFEGETFIYYRDHPWFAVAELPLRGLHHYQNALAVLAVGHSVGLTCDDMLGTLKHFFGLPHRCQKVTCIDSVDWYNDSKGTNIGAVIAALNSLGPLYKHIILIAGGDAKGADLSELKPTVCQYVSYLIILGQDADQFEQVFHDVMPCQRVANLTEAVSAARAVAQAGDAVLLSPACSSLDMFKNYEERGELFVKAVKELMHE